MTAARNDPRPPRRLRQPRLRAVLASGAAALLLAGCGGERAGEDERERERVAAADIALSAPQTRPQPAARPAAPAPQLQLESDPDPDVTERRSGIDWASALADSPDAAAISPQQTNRLAVPLLLPAGPIRAAGAAGAGPDVTLLEDGYFAVYPREKYDVVIHGTNMETETRDRAPAGGEPDAPRFDRTQTGAEVTLSRYGADYLVQFECTGFALGAACITEEEALDVASQLTVRAAP